ncbi:MAG TPA: ABC transporter permease [Candidatus Acidoferrales bacterium]|nr:ABC transporter permease [Candidatus Acidoferrales bacterium]
MRTLRAWLLRFGGLFARQRRDRELADEMESHLQMHIQDNLQRGMTPAEARRQALIKLGGVEQTKENYRDRRGLPFLDTLLQDIRFGFRMLRKSPGFTVVAVLTLALGIGASTAMFSALYGLIFRPLPYPNPSRLVMLWDSNRATGLKHIMVMEGSFPILRSHAKSFDGMAAFGYFAPRDQMPASTLSGTEERVSAGGVTSQLFSVLGVAPILGREFLPSENVATQSGATWQSPHLAILSYAFWRDHYGTSPDVIGKTLSLSELGYRTQFTIVGVMPKGFDFPYPLYPAKPDVWLNLAVPNWTFAQGNILNVVGRLRPGVSIAQAEAEIHTIADGIRAQYPKVYKNEEVDVSPLSSEFIRAVPSVLWILVAAFSLILLIGCANVGNLLLVRAVSREREMAIRATLGAGRLALIRHMLAEALLLAVAGGALGLLLAYGTLHVFLAVLPTSIYIPRLDSVALDVRMLALAAGLSVLAASVFSVLPSVRLTRPNLNETLKSGSTRREHAGHSVLRRPGSMLVIFEVSLALVLLTGTLLMLRSMQKLLAVNSRFQPEHMLSLKVDLSNAYLMQLPDSFSMLPLYQQFEQRVAVLPGVESVALADAFPLVPHAHTSEMFKAEGGGGRIAEEFQPADMRIVTPGYFPMIDMNLVRGRWFEDADVLKSLPVAVINETMAERYWRDGDPIGLKVKPYRRFTMEDVAYTIVGVVRDPKRFGSGDTPDPTVFLDYSQVQLGSFTAVVRTAGMPKGIAAGLRDAALQMVPGQTFVGNVKTGEELVSEETAMPRFATQLLTAFAGLALLLAVVGIYGLISYYTSQRTHEIGIRMALGAQRSDVMRLVLGEGILLAGLGIAAGLFASYGFANSLASLRYGVGSADLFSFAGAAVLFFFVALAACYIPARRAMKVDPMVALRYE